MGKENSRTGSLAAQLSVRTGIVLVILLLFIISGILYLSYMHGVKNAEESLKSSAEMNAYKAETYLLRTNEQLKALAKAVSGLEGLPPPQSHAKEKSLLKESLEGGDYYIVNTYWEPDTFFKSTPNGRLNSAQSGEAEISTSADYENYSKSGLYSYVRENSLTYITEPYKINSESGEAFQVIEAGLAMRRANGDFLGAASFIIGLDSLSGLTEAADTYKSAYSYLVSGSGTCLADSNDPGRAGAKLDEGLSGQTELYKETLDGKSVYKVLVPVSAQGIGTGWTSIYIVSRAEVLKVLNQNLILCIVAALIGLILLTLIMTVIIRRALRPVKPILRLAQDMDNGLTKTDIKVRVDNELGELADIIKNVTRSLNSCVSETDCILSAAAKGDLTVRFKQGCSGAFTTLKTSMEELISSLNHRLRRIAAAAGRLDMSAQEASRGASLMSDAAMRQTPLLQQLTAAVTAATEDAGKNAVSVKSASDNMGQTIETVRRGSEHMLNLTSVMADINEASNKINKVTKLVDDIAFQTNILALNAAVEAARAGESGKGFGVVAEEVRSLAIKSSQAANTTAELIKQSLDKVMQGVILTEEAGNALIEIEDKSNAVNELLGRINMTAAAQAASLTQISKGLSRVSGDINNGAAAAEKTSAASTELLSQSARLREELGEFKL